MTEKKLYLKTIQDCCDYLYAKTHEPIEYKKLITYLENNFEAIYLNQKKDHYSNPFIKNINNTLVSFNDLTSPIMKMNFEDSALIPLSKDIYAFKHLNHLKNDVHTHQCIEIDFIVEGNALLLFEDKQIKLCDGDICMISPTAKHNLLIEKDAFVINIFVRNKVLRAILNVDKEEIDILSQFIYKIIINRQSQPNYLLFRTNENPTIQEAIKQVILESHIYQDNYSSTLSLSWLKIFIYNILRNFESSSLYRPIEDTYKTLYEIINHIEQDYKQVTLSSLAQYFHYNEAYLSTLIKKNFECSFSEMLTNIKMTHAKALLLNTDMKISEIALEIGYHSVDHFIRVFTKLNKNTPGQYRKSFKNTQ